MCHRINNYNIKCRFCIGGGGGGGEILFLNKKKKNKKKKILFIGCWVSFII
jgi:hypothetical protein